MKNQEATNLGMKKALVCGGGGFIGTHMVNRLKREGYWVRAVDLKYPEFSKTEADDFVQGDLRDEKVCSLVLAVDGGFDEVYQFGADMGGAGFVFTGENDYNIMHNSSIINLNVTKICARFKKLGIPHPKKIFYSSSACIYPLRNQLDPDNPNCAEDSAYPAEPDSDYGWEKLFSEILYKAFQRETGIDVRIARFHNIFGVLGTWEGGREKAPASMCRKVALCPNGGEIDVWGTGEQTRSFLYVDECLEAVRRLMQSDHDEPINIGSDEMISINNLAKMAIDISGKNITIKNVETNALGVMGRNSDNTVIGDVLNWKPDYPLRTGMEHTYNWIVDQIKQQS